MSHDDHESSLTPTILLLVSAVLGFLCSNTFLADWYVNLLETKINFAIGSKSLFNKSFLLFINDGLMAVFFLFVGLELKRELLVGELCDVRKAALPVFAALGGMVAPALIYMVFNYGQDTASGWGIPMATDIAFALGLVTVLGSRVPKSLKVMLTAVAIVDDLGAILVIALFYTSTIGTGYLIGAFVCFLLCILMNKIGVTKVSLYMLVGLPLWYFMLKSGVHATIAGVMIAFTIPLAAKDKDKHIVLDDIFNKKASPLDSPAVFLEKSLVKWVGFLIIPLFAFANSGVSVGSVTFGSVAFGVIFGLVVGKPLGIVGFTLLAKARGLVTIPDELSMKHLIGMGMLAGIGFTMSLFIGSLAFTNPAYFDEAKIAIILASVISAVLGVVMLMSQDQQTSAPQVAESSSDE